MFFRLTAAGVEIDGQYSDDVDASTDWDGAWNGAVTLDAGGWSAELRIPLATLRFSDAEEQEWGFQVIRYLSRRKEDVHVDVLPAVDAWLRVTGRAPARDRAPGPSARV